MTSCNGVWSGSNCLQQCGAGKEADRYGFCRTALMEYDNPDLVRNTPSEKVQYRTTCRNTNMMLQMYTDKSNPNTACQRQCNATEFMEITTDMMKCWTVCPSGFIDAFTGMCIP